MQPTTAPSAVSIPRIDRFVVTALLGLAMATAQETPSSTRGRYHYEGVAPATNLHVPIHTAAADAGVAYGIWAAGSSYKASFHDGATYVPFLGAEYPHNLPLAWRTLSVRVGELELVTQNGRLDWTDWRAEYDLGAVVETYDVRDEGLEQTFVLRHPPGAAGDLVVRGAITTALHTAAASAAHQALVFHDDAGRPIVSYGAATAVDAHGARRAMTTSYAHGEVELRLDAEWLAAAAFPVVVDPLLGPATPISGAVRTAVDSVNEESLGGDVVWIAYSVAASASDSDLYVQRWSLAGVLGSTPFVDMTASWSTRGTRCGFDENSHYAIIVFDRTFATGLRYLRFHRHLSSDSTTSTAYDPIAATDNAWRADVATFSITSLSPHGAFVVWQQEPNGGGAFAETSSSDIFGCHVNMYTGATTTPLPIVNTLGVDHERPRTNSRSTTAHSKVVYQYYATLASNDDWDVAVRDVDSSGVVSPPFVIDNASPDHKFAPQIDGVDDVFAVAFTSSTLAQQPGKPTGTNGHQIRAVRLNWDSAPSEPFGTVLLQSNNDARLELEGFAVDKGSWSLWGLMFRSTTTQNLYFRTIGYRAQPLQAETVFVPAGSDTAVGGGVSNTGSGEFTLAYAKNGGGGANYVTFDRFEFPAVQPSTATGSGCSPASIHWLGRQQIGNENGFVAVSGAPVNAIHLLLVALAPTQAVFNGNPLVVDGCSLLVPAAGPDYVGLLASTGIIASVFWQIPLPEYLTNDTIYFQDFHTDAVSLQFRSTQRLEVPIVK